MELKLDIIQKEFIDLYNRLKTNELIIEPTLTESKKWSCGFMFELTPFFIERSRGELKSYDILDSKPNESYYKEASFVDNIICNILNFNDQKKTSFANFIHSNNKIKKIGISLFHTWTKLK
ncbi:hypothetical protein PJW08_00280 (plasmid) [Tenacibaculum finnmarkense]|nr:hypothetical protein PJW08_00280 [Tenacibaculum finnmarkense]